MKKRNENYPLFLSRRSYNKGVVNTTENFPTVVGLSPSIIIFPTFVGLSLRNDNSWYLLILCHKEKETGLDFPVLFSHVYGWQRLQGT